MKDFELQNVFKRYDITLTKSKNLLIKQIRLGKSVKVENIKEKTIVISKFYSLKKKLSTEESQHICIKCN